MELAVAKALKPSLRREFIIQEALSEELLCLNGNSVIGGEDFSVDDLLDLSNGDSLHHCEQQEEEDYDEEKDSLSLSSSHSQDSNSNSTDASYDSIFSTELVVPAGDLADLEWVSRYVDDSLPELALLYPLQTNALPEPEPQPDNRACLPKKTPCFPSELKFTAKARTVKTRKPNPCVWSLSPLLTCSSSPSPSPCSSAVSGEPPAKKQKRKAEAQAVVAQAQVQRRCSHCQVQKTPQWRTGPLGAKTLCNACGVRYKSGRLFSEYRPACSPTFCSEIHSNSHRKVLEIRKKKGMVGPEPGLPAQTRMVPTC